MPHGAGRAFSIRGKLPRYIHSHRPRDPLGNRRRSLPPPFPGRTAPLRKQPYPGRPLWRALRRAPRFSVASSCVRLPTSAELKADSERVYTRCHSPESLILQVYFPVNHQVSSVNRRHVPLPSVPGLSVASRPVYSAPFPSYEAEQHHADCNLKGNSVPRTCTTVAAGNEPHLPRVNGGRGNTHHLDCRAAPSQGPASQSTAHRAGEAPAGTVRERDRPDRAVGEKTP